MIAPLALVVTKKSYPIKFANDDDYCNATITIRKTEADWCYRDVLIVANRR